MKSTRSTKSQSAAKRATRNLDRAESLLRRADDSDPRIKLTPHGRTPRDQETMPALNPPEANAKATPPAVPGKVPPIEQQKRNAVTALIEPLLNQLRKHAHPDAPLCIGQSLHAIECLAATLDAVRAGIVPIHGIEDFAGHLVGWMGQPRTCPRCGK